ncbi:hypothetical protein ABZT43_43805 [Streptomyces sp. NPDC005349]|uniref:hypothetical protein n=1 Tax=Streptomyces sp. NPDC005349 TaxID=3157037 RepID=UPI0033BA12E1
MATTNWFDGRAEELIPTAPGLINVSMGGRPDAPATVCWPRLKMDGTVWRYQYEHPRPTARQGRCPFWAPREGGQPVPVHGLRKVADAIEGSTLRTLQRTTHLSAGENPEGATPEIDAFLATLHAAARSGEVHNGKYSTGDDPARVGPEIHGRYRHIELR